MKRLIAISGGALLLSAFAACEPYLSLDEAVTGKSCGAEGCPDGFFCNAEMKCQLNGTIETGSAPVRPAPGAEGGAAGASAAPGSEGSAGAESGSAAGSAGAGAETEPMAAAGAGGAPGGGGSGVTEPGGNAGGSSLPPNPGEADAGGCRTVVLYKDLDGDGFGGNEPGDLAEGCPPIAGYSTVNGDCHDEVPSTADPAHLVFPGQTAFFGSPYPTENGLSFDYDCSGVEEVDPSPAFVPAPANCEEFEAPFCDASAGYVPNARSGEGVNPLCGVRERATCFGASECVQDRIGPGDPVPCR